MNTDFKKYSRDKRSPKPKSETVSRVMSANKDRNTGPEFLLRKALWSCGKRGYRLHKCVGSTRPDIVFPKYKVAIFVNGCFWHRCPYCKLPLPKNNHDFWKKKFDANKKRDLRKTKELGKLGWKVFTVWECEIKKNVKNVAKKIKLK